MRVLPHRVCALCGRAVGVSLQQHPRESQQRVCLKGLKRSRDASNGSNGRASPPQVDPEADSKDAPRAHPGALIAFYINGRALGPAFSDILPGTYYPAASLYMGGHVSYNFGPDFKHPPAALPRGVPPPRAMIDLHPPGPPGAPCAPPLAGDEGGVAGATPAAAAPADCVPTPADAAGVAGAAAPAEAEAAV